MTCLHRTTVTLTLLCLLIPIFGQTAQSQTSAADSQKTFIIAGRVGVANVAMRGLPGDPVTDDNGVYTAKVPRGWGGIVTPAKEGFVFDPPNRNYGKVVEDQPNQDYIAKLFTFTISGNAGASGVLMQGLPDSPVTDQNGGYTASVPYGWAGRVVPAKEGCSFEPVRKEYVRVVANLRNQDYVARVRMLTIPNAGGHVFVIPTAQIMPDKVAETTEDLRIMLQILREKLSEPRMIQGAFVNFGDFFGDRDRALEAFYLQGSAAVFVLEMDSPFAFAPAPSGGGEEGKETVDPVWQRARQRLAAPQTPAPGEAGKMDFQQFQEDLLKTLRHAANLRSVEPNESVIVTIIAHEESGAWPGPASAGGSYGARGGGWFEGSSSSTSSSSFGPSGGSTYADSRTRSSGATAGRGAPGRAGPGAAPAGPGTVLTIQAKKADIDAFAKGGLSFEQFQQRVKTFTY